METKNKLKSYISEQALEDIRIRGKRIKSYFTVRAIEDYIGGMIAGTVMGMIISTLGAVVFGIILFLCYFF